MEFVNSMDKPKMEEEEEEEDGFLGFLGVAGGTRGSNGERRVNIEGLQRVILLLLL